MRGKIKKYFSKIFLKKSGIIMLSKNRRRGSSSLGINFSFLDKDASNWRGSFLFFFSFSSLFLSFLFSSFLSLPLFSSSLKKNKLVGEKRKRQRVTWMWKMAMEDIQQKIRQLDGIPQLIHLLEKVLSLFSLSSSVFFSLFYLSLLSSSLFCLLLFCLLLSFVFFSLTLSLLTFRKIGSGRGKKKSRASSQIILKAVFAKREELESK